MILKTLEKNWAYEAEINHTNAAFGKKCLDFNGLKLYGS